MKSKKCLIFLVLFLIIIIPVQLVQAQDEDPPPLELDDELIDALLFMAIDADLLSGKNQTPYLTGVRDIINDHYENQLDLMLNLPDDQFNHGDYDRLEQLRNSTNDKLDMKIYQSKVDDDWLIKELLNPLFDRNKFIKENLPVNVRKVVNGTANPSKEYLELLDDQINQQAHEHLNEILGPCLLGIMPSLLPVFQNSPDWVYHPPEIGGSSSPILSPTQSASQDDPAPVYSEQDQIKTRPLRFSNNGFEPVTVVVESYEPAPGLDPGLPSPSTVVFPESNPSAYFELPLGTYTFCYYWQLDEDFNHDDYFDYHHKSTSSVTLNNNSPDNPENAVSMTLNPDNNVSNPNGKCGDLPTFSADNLTPEEKANQGTHTYHQTCSGNFLGSSCDDDEVEILTPTFEFTGDTVIVTEGGEFYVLPHSAINQYLSETLESGGNIVYTFTMEGFWMYYTHGGTENNAILTNIRQ
ncbi:MAG: hypothetical protein JEZ06_15255 [Anaerolineaceae bacterium]|nr:hypothetical protein [Anaerolineaceae bacterium]